MEAIKNKVAFTQDQVDSNMPEDSGRALTVPLDVELPEIPEVFSHLRGLFFISGQALQTGMGLIPLTWSEIKAFIEVNELELTLWERGMLRKMSEAYCNEYSHATSPTRPAPYTRVIADEEEANIVKGMQLAAAMAAFRKIK